MTDQRRSWVGGCTIGQVLRTTAGRFGERDAVVFPQAALRYSFAEFDSLVDDVAAYRAISFIFHFDPHMGDMNACRATVCSAI